jgi:dimethylglycine dehydrogenase
VNEPIPRCRANFIGKAAALKEREAGVDKKLVTLIVDADDVDCAHDEAVFDNGECVGFVTSGGYAHFCQHSVAMATAEAPFEVEILGELRPARVQAQALYDPSGSRMWA